MDDSQDSSLQTLASVLAGGLGGYLDAQNQQPVYVAQPTPQTAYGVAGTGQQTAASQAVAPQWLMLAGIAVVAFLLLKKL